MSVKSEIGQQFLKIRYFIAYFTAVPLKMLGKFGLCIQINFGRPNAVIG